MTSSLLLLAALWTVTTAQVLTPSLLTISHRKPIRASSTCGEHNGQPINEVYCSLTGSTQYSPLNYYSYQDDTTHPLAYREMRQEREAFIQGGHGCGHCMAGTENAHPAENMVDGNTSWWQSPPLSRGMEFNHVNITIDLEQEFHVAYVWIQMANSPKPGTWILERSTDYGKTFQPWYYFAETPAECMRRFGMESLSPISEDDRVVCRSDLAGIHPLENAEMVIKILEHRPSRFKFSSSEALQNFTRATNVRLRLLGTRTLQGHLMDLNDRSDPTVTRRYFYSIKEILMGGRCVCNGHAGTCDILDPRRPRTLLCRCEHNTCGDMCERCCPGFLQKKWQPTTAHNNFTCEPCNCFGRSDECVYDEDVFVNRLSLDIHGNYEGGGRCLNCRDNTEGVNCNKCVFGYYRQHGVHWNDTMPCKPCRCDPNKHTGDCEEGTGKCYCQPRFQGDNCDQCAPGYYDPPECKQCECAVDGTLDGTCLPEGGQCPCKPGFGGTFCETCEPGFTNITAGCKECVCDETGAAHTNCSATTGQCVCKPSFSGLHCDSCQIGFYGFPNCTFCNCDPVGTEGGICDQHSGQCMCKDGFVGEKCDQCDIGYYGYPNCKECNCMGAGAKALECDATSGQCPCYANFTARTCDKCAVGFYDYPNCKACSCLIEGAKGQACDSKGQCYCKGNFEGERCDRCKPNFYNFPACEECNCHPAGVTPDFAGCDKVQPGELCSCRKNVDGRICDQCKPTFWDLQYHHTDGCIECDCNLNGTLAMLNTCDLKSGQCHCKRNAAGRQCDKCADGFYNLEGFNQLGCQPCNCDIGGALRADCDGITGQCRCRPRVTGLRCDKPIDNHYFPTLWHHQYEAEDGHTDDQRPVRFAVDEAQFPSYSWRGYAVFSPIQEKINMDIDVAKASVYRLLFKYHNPTMVPITAVVDVAPKMTHTQDIAQSEKVTFAPTDSPSVKEVTVAGKPFVLNPGKWTLSVGTKQRLFLDYVVVLPAEYYLGTILKERAAPPCEANNAHNSTCVDLLYPPMAIAARADVTENTDTFKEVKMDGTTTDLSMVPIELLPEIIGPASYVQTGDEGKVIETKIEVPEDYDYAVVVEYHNHRRSRLPVAVEVDQEGTVKLNGTITIHNCPFATFCREVVSEGGMVATIPLKKGPATVQLHVPPSADFGLASVNLISKNEWNKEYLQQVPVCVRKDGRCVPQQYPPAGNSIVAEAEAGQEDPISGDKLPFPIANPKDVVVMPLDESQGTLEVTGVVPARGHYMFLVHYFNPDNTPLNVGVVLQNDHFFEATVPLAYCPSVSGCRALIRDKEKPEVIQFWMEDKYTATLYHNNTQKGPIFIDSITAVPFHSYNENLMKPLPIDLSSEFIQQCSADFYQNDPQTVSDFCREKIFSLTTDFNAAAFSCDCNPRGSESFCCDEYGGQCKCKPNIIGRRCERCAPGHYNYPECIKCKCSIGQQCDEQTGQCFCPPHVEGTSCDKCVSYAFGYDPLIGCQKCGCHIQGSEGASLQCDPNSGQCLCRESIGGRQCDRCLAGFYGFPHCYSCRCNSAGTTEEICDPSTAQCTCKENVGGAGCDTCKSGTFDLSADNPKGCINCFCFGTTDQCRSSMFPVSISSVDMSMFTTNDPSGVLDFENDIVTYTATDNSTASVYFNVPIEHGADYTTSYGLLLYFQLSVQPRDEHPRMSTDADVRLYGNNMTAEFWAPEQPADPREAFNVRVKLVPENFLSSSGQPITRNDLMMILHSLQNITLKASYYSNPSEAQLIDFGLEVSGEHFPLSAIKASSVEQCVCPAPYTGASCQHCAPGYYRVQSGSFLGACVPCECNGHSGSCDPDTGVCFDCQHSTHGDHCELCEEGHYGDATDGSPYSCMPCQCPFSPTNNFATGCQVSEYGQLLSCDCKPGYAGDRCDRCDAGYFGEPQRPGGSCQPCDCNDNNNLTDSRACHPVTGDCYLCERNTDGRKCEYCAQWYYGDAVAAKNCTACTCDQCGSAMCDNQVGECQCKPNVEGLNCDRCIPDHWGFSRCGGCHPCHCGVASSSSQCDDETGQCQCRPGAVGLRCEHCEHGFWNYGEYGCQKCDCEADLSMGTVCDVRTGQCHCQEGATGARCDQCLQSYLRIPTFGCRRCDECVHHLVSDVDNLGLHIHHLNVSIGNISSATVVGARLSRNSKNVAKYTEIANLLSGDQYTSFVGDARGALANMSQLVNSAERSHSVADNDFERAMNMTDTAGEVLQDIRRRAADSSAAVDHAKNLVASLGSHSSALIIDPKWVEYAEETLHQLEAATADGMPEEATRVPKKIAEVQEELNQRKEKLDGLKEKLESAHQNSTKVADYLSDAQKLLKQSRKNAEEARKAASGVSTLKLEGLAKALTDSRDKAIEEQSAVSGVLLEVKNLTEQAKDALESVGNSLTNLAEVRAELAETVEPKREKRQAPYDSAEVAAKIVELEIEADKLQHNFGSAKLESQNAVEAATAYSNLTDALTNAQEKAQWTIDEMDELSKGLQRKKDQVKQALNGSANLVRQASNLQQSTLNALKKEAAETESRIDRLTTMVDGMRRNAEGIRSSLVSPLNETTFADVEKSADHVNSLLADTDKVLASARDDLAELQEATDKAVSDATDALQGIKKTKSNVKELSVLVPKLMESYDNMHNSATNRTAKVEACVDKIAALKEQIAVARDAANRIKLGAHFEQGSSLDLAMPHRVARSAAHTDIAFHFRTAKEHGIPLFFGNEEGSAGTRAVPTDDYIAVEIEYGQPKVTINLGEKPLVIKLNTRVADNQWRQLSVERIGRSATVKLYKPNSEEVEEVQKGTAEGNKSILNLHQTMSRLFVGGIPAGSRIAKDVRNRAFEGDIEDLTLHGEPVGLWNAKTGGAVAVRGAEPRPRTKESSAQQGVSLNGDGYIVYQMGYWNPRKRAIFSLSFLTFSPDGLLFFIGKDRDFFALELSAGSVKLSLDFGSGAAQWLADAITYNDGQWHTVAVARDERHVKMEVDGVTVAEGDAPGDMSTLSVTDYLYLGGTPTGVNTRSPIEPFRGCIKSVRLGSDEMDLYASYASKGVRNACPLGTVNTVSILSDRSTAVFENITASNEMDVSLRFKTRRSTGTLLTIQSDEDDLLSLKIEDGVLVATAGDDRVSLELASAADEQWHYVSVRKTKEILRVDVDDLHSKEERRANGDDVAPGEMARILFGRHDTASFVGCVGDVSYNGELLDFAKAKIHEVSLTGCSLAADVVKTTVSTTSESVPTTLEAPANLLITTEVMTTVAPTEAETVADGACALGLDPRPPKDEVDGTRFGLQPNSRLEYEVMPDSFDKSGTFSLQIRPSALNGVIMFAANDKHTDHIGLFLLNGRLVLSFDTGSGQTIIRSNRSILNGEWHSVKASRRGSEGLLVVDDESTEAVVSAGTDAIDTQPPLYLGGIPNELASYARTIVPGVRTEFGGCIREFKLNDKKFDTVARDHGIGECSVRTESGLYFGKEGGYAILRKEFEVGKSFSAELEVRPRTQNGVLFSVGVIEYLTVQLLNGNVKFTVNSGSGDESLIYTPPTANTICDGHWHSIKIMKKKNLMTLTVDGKSNLNIMKRGKKHETVTKDPIYLGGVPESVVSKGLETREPYVGCMRIMNLGGGKKDKMRRKKQLDVSMLDIYGNVNKQECPLN
ncbi:hypothetical protein V3C99_010722 [Haemonchus contortus]